ncbi:MAG: hypothetical protein WBD71_02760 [Xanthobacteraceae bacterium]
MRSASNFNPEWGYLAPAPSFMRTLRVILVATAIGATAGAAVVLSLIDRPAGTGDKTASTAHAIVTSVQVAPAAAVPLAAVATAAVPVKLTAAEPASASPHPGSAPMAQPIEASAAAQHAAPPMPAVSTQSATIAPPQAFPNMTVPERSASDARMAAPRPANGIAALSYASPSADDERAADVPDPALLRPEPAEKRARHHVASDYAANNKNRQPPSLSAFLRRIFNPGPSGTSHYPDR